MNTAVVLFSYSLDKVSAGWTSIPSAFHHRRGSLAFWPALGPFSGLLQQLYVLPVLGTQSGVSPQQGRGAESSFFPAAHRALDAALDAHLVFWAARTHGWLTSNFSSTSTQGTLSRSSSSKPRHKTPIRPNGPKSHPVWTQLWTLPRMWQSQFLWAMCASASTPSY